MSTEILRIATRESPLALWQAKHVSAALESAHPDLRTELVPMTTRGDQILDSPLAKIGGKGLFVKELERAMLVNEADIAVHSMKDVPMEFPEGLELAVICAREEPSDALVSPRYSSISDLPEGARVGTSSLRRQCQLRHWRSDLEIIDLRGNVGTRLAKLDAGDYDAIILAAAGLIRLGMADRISERLPHDICLPASGQGAIGIESRSGDSRIQQRLECLNDRETALRVRAERAVVARLEGSCQVPIGCFATVSGERMTLAALVGTVDGTRLLRSSRTDSVEAPEQLGGAVADDLLAQGAGEILAAVTEAD